MDVSIKRKKKLTLYANFGKVRQFFRLLVKNYFLKFQSFNKTQYIYLQNIGLVLTLIFWLTLGRHLVFFGSDFAKHL